MNRIVLALIVVFSMVQLSSGTNETYFSYQGVCLNGGTVVNLLDDDYRCECKDLYSGSNCEYCQCDTKRGFCSSFGNGLCRVNKVVKPGQSLYEYLRQSSTILMYTNMMFALGLAIILCAIWILFGLFWGSASILKVINNKLNCTW